MSTVWNGTGRPENVRTSGQEDALLNAVRENTRVLSAALAELAERPIEGKAVLDSGKVLGVLRRMSDEIVTTSGSGRL